MSSIRGSRDTGWLADAVSGLRAEAPHDGVAEVHLDIAGRAARVRYAEPALADALGRATRHLTRPECAAADLTIDCWTAPGPVPSLPPGAPATGTVYVDDGATVLTWDAPAGPLLGYDREARHGWARFASVDSIPMWQRATPFRRILHWWSADSGLQLVHAAAVGHPTGGLLLVGRGGSGKSTTALACLEAGLGFAGDDYCLLSPGDPPWLHGLYLSGKGDARSAQLLPRLRESFARTPVDPTDDKSVLFADDVRPDSVSTGFPLRAILVPRLAGGADSSLSPIGPAIALRALAPSTVMQMPDSRAAGLARLAGIVQRLPAWELSLGSDPAGAAGLIAELLDRQLVP